MTLVLYGVLLLVGVTLLIITALRVLVGGIADSSGRTSVAQRGSGGSAQRILEERYAAGELSTEEYHHRGRVLERRD